MRVMMIDDSVKKAEAVQSLIADSFSDFNLQFDVCTSIASASSYLAAEKYDVVIIDLMLPYVDAGPAQDLTTEVVNLVLLNEQNRDAYIIALSQHEELVEEQRRNLTSHGILCIHYDEQSNLWKTTLELFLIRIRRNDEIDFAIICAVSKEFAAFKRTGVQLGVRKPVKDLDVQEATIGRSKGMLVLLPMMGLVSAAVTTSKVIQFFSPKIIAMSGICAGIKDKSEMGQIVIGRHSWDYQSGKWNDGEFEFEAYSVEIDENVRLQLSALSDEEKLLDELESGLECPRPKRTKPKIAPIASGSAVLAQAEKIEEIEKQHRKAAAVDMETYGVYRAAHLSCHTGLRFFSAKAVVDFGDSIKNDEFQEYGAIVSARFVERALRRFL
jgi:adenosylhomocysteine nucleosidase